MRDVIDAQIRNHAAVVQTLDNKEVAYAVFSHLMDSQIMESRWNEATNSMGSSYVKAASNHGTAEIKDLADTARRAWS